MKNKADIPKIHFIGVGGISMSALAKWCALTGYRVSGSDRNYSGILNDLGALGIYTYVGINEAVAASADTVVYTSAVSADNPELAAARRAGVKALERHVFLGEMQKAFDKVIAVSGTHGKTTVTALISAVFKKAEMSFTAHIGGEAADLNGNLYAAGKDFFVTEACEYRRNFLSLNPDCTVILNIESDHPDCYGDIGELTDSFAEFVKNTRGGGIIVLNDNIAPENLHICKNKHMLTFGLNESSYCRAENISEHSGICEYDVYIKGEFFARVRPRLAGRHNIFNALAAITVCSYYGVDKKSIVSALEHFGGVKRRFELVKRINGADIILDYAHHPSEIKATLAAAKAVSKGEVKAYFQPHTYTRTDKYFDEFASCFTDADEISLLPTYPARETADMGRTAFELFYYINSNIREVSYFDNFLDAAANILKTARPDDLVLILGAGDINEIINLI